MDCEIELTMDNAYPNRTTGGFTSRCKACSKIYNKKYRDENADKVTNTELKRIYGITIDEYNQRLIHQMFGCAICKLPCKTGNKLSVDHNHITGEVRGLLCRKCNAAVGWLNDDEDLIWKIMEYLKRTTWKDEVA